MATTYKYSLFCNECGHQWLLELDSSWESNDGLADFDETTACPKCGANGASVVEAI